MRVIRQSPAAISCNVTAGKSVAVLIKGSKKGGRTNDNSADTKIEREWIFVTGPSAVEKQGKVWEEKGRDMRCSNVETGFGVEMHSFLYCDRN